MTQQEKQSLLNEQHLIVNNAEAELKATDYIAAKIAEGKATKTEYKEKIDQRQQWRDQINAAQEEIARIEAVETEDDASRLEE
jgi:hypothetical protein